MIKPDAAFDRSNFNDTCDWREGEAWVVGDDEDGAEDVLAEIIAESASSVFVVWVGDHGDEDLASSLSLGTCSLAFTAAACWGEREICNDDCVGPATFDLDTFAGSRSPFYEMKMR